MAAPAAPAAPRTAPARRSASAPPPADTARCPWLNDALPVASRVSMLLAQMTLTDKIALMDGQNGTATNGAEGDTPAIPALCVPEINEEDGPAGVADGVTGATQLPSPIADASSWDPTLARAYGRVIGTEERAKGNDVVYAPTVNIARDPRWGRNFESLGEDPLLTGTLGDAEIAGIQAERVIAQVKHYAVYDIETNRNTPLDDDIVSERALHEIYLPPFYDAVTRAGAGSVMCSYSSPDGTYACENAPLLSILEQRWGFPGWVGSDYGATHAAAAAADAGLDQEQAGFWFGAPLALAVQDGEVPMATIDDAVTRILTELFRFDLFDRPATGTETTVASTPAHVAFAREDAERGTVLLKDAAGILPLSGSDRSIAVIGPDATSEPDTAGSGSAGVRATGHVVSPLEGIRARAGRTVTVRADPSASPAAAATAARHARIAIVFASNREHEGADLRSITLQRDQDRLIDAVARANPRTIVVLDTGGPVAMPWLSRVAGVLEAWYPGQQDGAAIAPVLYGDVDPSGHLPETFPRSLSQIPTRSRARFPGAHGRVSYADGLQVGYRYYDTAHVTPLFPFGYGLSYTRFRYSGLTVSRRVVHNLTSAPGAGQSTTELTVSATVTNTGRRAGADVAQLYLGDPRSAGEPVRQLEGFARVYLRPGRSRRVTFALSGHALSFFDTAADGWVVPDGRFAVQVGDSSALADLPLRATFSVDRTLGARAVTVAVGPVLAPGTSTTVTARFANAGDVALNGARAALTAPAGWTVTPLPGAPTTVAAHASAQWRWTVTVPLAAQSTGASLRADVTGGGSAPVVAATQTAQVGVEGAVGVATPTVAPQLAPGGSVTEQVQLSNHLAQPAQVTLSPQPPAGVTVTPDPDVVTVPAGATVSSVLTITAAPSAAGNDTVPLAVTTAVGGATLSQTPAGLPVDIYYPSLAAAADNVGSSDDGDVSSGGFDSRGDSFSAQQLSAAGLAPGAPFTHDGIAYTWPAQAPGTPDDVVADGQVITLSGSGTTLGLVGAGSGGMAGGPVTVVYTDGTISSHEVTFADWYADRAAPGGDVVTTTPDWNHRPGRLPHPVSVYAASMPLDPGKTVAEVILPTIGSQAKDASAPLHVFALGIGG